MGWTTPQNWTSTPFTASNLNTQIRDNFLALKDPPSAIYDANEGTDLSLASTSWADVDATEGKFQQTLTTNGGAIMVCLNASFGASAALVFYLDVMVDGVPYGVTTLGAGDGLLATRMEAVGTAIDAQVFFFRILQNIAAGSHIFKLRYKVNTGTATLYRGAGTANADIIPQFFVREIS